MIIWSGCICTFTLIAGYPVGVHPLAVPVHQGRFDSPTKNYMSREKFSAKEYGILIRVVPDTDFAGYPANNFSNAGYLAGRITEYPTFMIAISFLFYTFIRF